MFPLDSTIEMLSNGTNISWGPQLEAKSNPAAGRPGLPPEGVWELGRSGCASRDLEFDSSFESPQCVESESVAISWGLHVP